MESYSDFDYSLELPSFDDDSASADAILQRPLETDISNVRQVAHDFLPLKGPFSVDAGDQIDYNEFGPASMPYLPSRYIDVHAGPRTLQGPRYGSLALEQSLNVPDFLDELASTSPTQPDSTHTDSSEADADIERQQQQQQRQQQQKQLIGNNPLGTASLNFTVFDRRNISILIISVIVTMTFTAAVTSSGLQYVCENITLVEPMDEPPCKPIKKPDDQKMEKANLEEGMSKATPETSYTQSPTIATTTDSIVTTAAKKKKLKWNRELEEEAKIVLKKFEKEAKRYLKDLL